MTGAAVGALVGWPVGDRVTAATATDDTVAEENVVVEDEADAMASVRVVSPLAAVVRVVLTALSRLWWRCGGGSMVVM